jgi:hypothetical protein
MVTYQLYYFQSEKGKEGERSSFPTDRVVGFFAPYRIQFELNAERK